MRLNGWQNGMDNVHDDHELNESTLRRAVNVDILDKGNARRRRGSSLMLAMTNAHSLWSDGKDLALFILGNAIHRLWKNGTSTMLGAVLAGVNRLSYAEAHDAVYFSCGTAKGRVRAGILEPWGIEVPASLPHLDATHGSLEPGAYFAALTYLLADGRESGASVLTKITLGERGGIATLGMPVPMSGAVVRKRLYLSMTNGEQLYLAKEGGAMDQFFVVDAPPTGAELRMAYLSEPPLATSIALSNGRLFMVDALDPKVVWYTEAMDFDHVNRRKNFYQFPTPVTLIIGTRTGLYVCADHTYYIGQAGIDAQDSFRVVHEYGGVAGSAARIPNSMEFMWMSEAGAVIGHDGGTVDILAQPNLVPGVMTEAAGMMRESDGIKQYVVVARNSEGSSLEAGSYAEAEIIRKSD